MDIAKTSAMILERTLDLRLSENEKKNPTKFGKEFIVQPKINQHSLKRPSKGIKKKTIARFPVVFEQYTQEKHRSTHESVF